MALQTAALAESGTTQDQIARAFETLRKPLSVTAFVALVLTWSLVAFLRFEWTPQFWYLVPLLVALALVVVLDVQTKLIPDVLTVPGIAYAFTGAAFFGTQAIGPALFGATVGGGVVLLIAVISRGGVGGGDIKLMAMLGALLGWNGALAVIAFSQLTGCMIALALLISRGARRPDTLPIGAIISFLGAVMLLGMSEPF
jgi:leader peptidase (prepilin peptidase)/N-methyltransferase